MESNFVSVFKMDGIPILPPLVNDEVRAAVAVYRQKAIEIEKRLQEKRRTLTVNVVSQSIDANDLATKEDVSVLDGNDVADSSASDRTVEAPTLESLTITPTEVVEDPVFIAPVNVVEGSPTVISPKILPVESLPEPLQQEAIGPVVVKETDDSNKSETNYNSISNQSQQSNLEQASWTSPTRTVTPTSEQALPWTPLVRSNTFVLEKPSIELGNLQQTSHSTPIDRPALDDAVDECKADPKEHETFPVQNKPNAAVPNAFEDKENTPVKSNPNSIATEKQNKPDTDPLKCRPKRRTVSRRISHSSAGSGRATDRAFESVAHALTTHEERMKELLKRQEEERLMLEKSFREKTQELVALCAKSLTLEEGNGMLEVNNDESLRRMSATAIVRTKTPDLNAASSVSQLSLCDMSYDSCTDTDDAAYQTCQANGTSEENVNNSEHTLTEDQSHIDHSVATNNSSLCTATMDKDNNGNDDFSLLPFRMMELQRHRAATVINAYARGYLTRRLFKTEEVQNIKQKIADIVCFLISSQTQFTGRKEDANQAALRRDAGKHIALCLDRLHDIFVNWTSRERLQMIRRDRCLKRKLTLPRDRKKV